MSSPMDIDNSSAICSAIASSDHPISDDEDGLSDVTKHSARTFDSTATTLAWDEPMETVSKQEAYATPTSSSHCWSSPSSETFNIRGKGYMKDRKKVPSDEAVFRSLGVDIFQCEGFAPTNIASHPGLLNGRLRDIPTFLVNFRFSWGALVLYYEIPSHFLSELRNKYSPSSSSTNESSASINDNIGHIVDELSSPHDKAILRFLCSADESKTCKLKLIPRIVEGNILVKKLVTGKPVIIGNKLPIAWTYEEAKEGKAEFLEADLDIGSSSKSAQSIVRVCRKYMKSLTVDFGWVVEAEEEEELPERLLACTRVHHIDSKSIPILRWN